MNVEGEHFRTIWREPETDVVKIIDQRKLPFVFEIEELTDVDAVAKAIRDMHVRGAGLIGATAGYGMFLAAKQAAGDATKLEKFAAQLVATRPTAVNLRWAVDRQCNELAGIASASGQVEKARAVADTIADEDAAWCRTLGQHGRGLLEKIASTKSPGEVVNVLTHCNAGWLAFVDYGSATAPIYAAHDAGIPLHVWVDETRPRNQGARLTAWELGQHGVAHTVIADNVGGHLMQHGLVDLVITGTDRTTHTGDVANKIGTYLKALAAKDNAVPFYVALPSSTIDWQLRDGVAEIPIEQREGDEVAKIGGWDEERNAEVEVRLTPEGSAAGNFAFDVTPARLVTGLITERGICSASEEGVYSLYPEQRPPK